MRHTRKTRLAVLALAAVIATVVAVAAVAAPRDERQGRTIRLVERTNALQFIDIAPSGESLGDYVVIASDLYDQATNAKVGSSHEVCTRVILGTTRQCSLTYYFRGGFLTLQGPYHDDGSFTMAITGGTGIFRTVSGWMDGTTTKVDFHPDGSASAEYAETFHVIVGSSD